MIHAPYNFIPFSEKVIKRYKDINDLPPHDKIQPDLLSGEIKVTVTAKTPIFISNGEKEDKTVDFYRGPSGEYEIPGSTMRGLIRENVQILGFGKVRTGVDVEDYRILFRDVASGRYTLSKAENIYYHNIMKVKNEQNQDDHTNYIKYGYITNNHGTYFIREIKESLRKVTRKQVKDDLFPNSELENATLIDVEYDKNKKKYYRYEKNEVTYDSSKQRGILLITGKSVTGAGKKRKEDKENSGKIKKEMKENHCYFFPEENTDTAKEKVTKEDILNYNMDYERRKSTLGDNYKFWELPKDGEKKPIFYIKHDEHTYFGMSLYFRIGYKHTIAYGLPVQKTQDGTVSPESDPLILDYVYSMFGFTSNQNQAYKSRVSFGDFQISQKKKPDKAVKYVLLGPKPTFFQAYLCEGKRYIDEDFKLRGYKKYWMKERSASELGDNENVLHTLRPLPVGTKFEGVIHYKNLKEDELGLLLWALKLEEGCCQNIGMGKPYGIGCVEITVDGIYNYDMRQLYQLQSLQGQRKEYLTDEIDKYIRYYKDTIAKLYFEDCNLEINDKKIENIPVIKDFLYFSRTFNPSDIDTTYIPYEGFKDKELKKEILPTIEEYREHRKPKKIICDDKKNQSNQKDKNQQNKNKQEKQLYPKDKTKGIAYSKMGEQRKDKRYNKHQTGVKTNGKVQSDRSKTKSEELDLSKITNMIHFNNKGKRK